MSRASRLTQYLLSLRVLPVSVTTSSCLLRRARTSDSSTKRKASVSRSLMRRYLLRCKSTRCSWWVCKRSSETETLALTG